MCDEDGFAIRRYEVLTVRSRSTTAEPLPSTVAHLVEARLRMRIEVDPDTNCWNWTGAKVGNGYGYMWLFGGPKYTHRVSAMLFLDFELSSPLWILHDCDNPRCCNPRHLRAGTRSDNIADAVARGRVGRGKLDIGDVVEIKRLLTLGYTHAAIAAEFGVTTSMIGQIRRGESWAHVSPETVLEPRRRGRRRKETESPSFLASVATDS
jgi:HNH endonuclease